MNAFMKKYWQLFLITGLFLLTVAVMGLCHRSQVETVGSYVAIDTQLSGESQYARYVRTKTNLSGQQELNDFPRAIADWYGQDYDTTEVKEHLEADVLLIRSYSRPEFSQPVILLIMQSAELSSFHMPNICYKVLGYLVDSVQDDYVVIKDQSWVGQTGKQEPGEMPTTLSARVRQELEFEPYQGRIPAKRFTASKQNEDGEVIERILVLYSVINDITITTDQIHMIRVSALIPLAGGYDDTLAAAKELMGEVVPLMFEPVEEPQMSITSLAESGAGGYLVIVLAFTIPLAMIVYALCIAIMTLRHANVTASVAGEDDSREETD